MIQKLAELIKSHAHFITERAKMLADDQRAKETEARILEDGRIDDKEIATLTTARTTRELIARRLPTIEEALRSVEKEIQEELRKCAQRYNRAVRTAAEAKQAEIIAANREYWEGNLRGIKQWVASAPIPAVRQIRDAHFHCGFSDQPSLDFWVTQARGFLECAARGVKALNLTVN